MNKVYRFVPASERTPKTTNLVHFRWGVDGKFMATGFYEDGHWYYSNCNVLIGFIQDLEWLEELEPIEGKGGEEVNKDIAKASIEYACQGGVHYGSGECDSRMKHFKAGAKWQQLQSNEKEEGNKEKSGD